VILRKLALAGLYVALLSGTAEATPSVPGISKAAAETAATSFLKRKGYQVETMVFRIPEQPQSLREAQRTSPILREPACARSLRGKRFWSVYAQPVVPSVGGDAFVYVDAKTGRVLLYIRGQ